MSTIGIGATYELVENLIRGRRRAGAVGGSDEEEAGGAGGK